MYWAGRGIETLLAVNLQRVSQWHKQPEKRKNPTISKALGHKRKESVTRLSVCQPRLEEVSASYTSTQTVLSYARRIPGATWGHQHCHSGISSLRKLSLCNHPPIHSLGSRSWPCAVGACAKHPNRMPLTGYHHLRRPGLFQAFQGCK